MLYTLTPQLNSQSINFFQEAGEWQNTKTDSFTLFSQKSIEKAKADQDTALILKSMLQLASKYYFSGKYMDAFETNWEILSIVDSTLHIREMAITYNRLGALYRVYGQYETALEMLDKSLILTRKGIEMGKIPASRLRQIYFAYSNYYKNKGQLDSSFIYLKKIRELFDNQKEPTNKYGFIHGELGFQYLMQSRYDSAQHFLQSALAILSDKKAPPPYLCMVHTYMGNLKLKQNQLQKAEQHFLKALEKAGKLNASTNFAKDAFSKLAEIYEKRNNYKKAYRYSQKSKIFHEKLYSIQSQDNSNLFAIRDAYKEKQRKQQTIIRNQKLKLLQQSEEILNTRMKFTFALLLLISVFTIWYVYIQQKRNKERKTQLQKILELKNKELTTSSVRGIEKDEFLRQLKVSLESSADKTNPVISDVINQINISKKQSWSEFEKHFTAINEDFFNNLRKKHHNLTPNELKICAMLKLNLSGKDMSRLIGISSRSVMTARYRLRKKMGIENGVNLQQYISEF